MVEEEVVTSSVDEEEQDPQLEKLKRRLPDVDDSTLQSLLEDSKSIALNRLFPFEEELPDSLPTKYENWQLRVCEYMYKHRDLLGIVSYSENGISISFSGDAIPSSFMRELTPNAGAVKPRKTESTN